MGRTRQKGSKDRHQEILEAAARVITDRGLAETRISDIAERCGVSPGLILYYFESKDRLLVEALTYANDQFYLRLSRELRRITSAREQLDRLIELSVPGLLPSTSASTSGRSGSRSGCARSAIPRWRRSARRSTAAGASRSPTSSARDAPPGSSREGVDADDLGQQIGAMIDGLAIQVLMNDTAFTPERMRDVCRDVAAKLIGFSLEPAPAGVTRVGVRSDPAAHAAPTP